MGIGVYETREFARGRGGDLEVESALGVGTTFTLVIPHDAESTVPDEAYSALEASH